MPSPHTAALILLLVAAVLISLGVVGLRLGRTRKRAVGGRASKAAAEAATTAQSSVVVDEAPRKTSSKKLPVAEGASDAHADAHGQGETPSLPPTFASSEPLPNLAPDAAELDDARASDSGESKAVLLYENDAHVGIDEATGPTDIVLTVASAQTDRGVTRRRNEDAYLVDPDAELYVVADGMGGYAGGDVASRIAVERVRDRLRDAADGSTATADAPRRGRELVAAVEAANDAIYKHAQTSAELHGMGTTLVAARFSSKKQRAYLAHVGDSRCYRLRDGNLRLMTTDHTLAARGLAGPLAGLVRRAVGIAPRVKVDLIVDVPTPGDVYLLCTDGLSKMVDDAEIQDILTRFVSDLDRACSALILAANARGGRDNITVVLVAVRDASHSVSASFTAAPESLSRTISNA